MLGLLFKLWKPLAGLSVAVMAWHMVPGPIRHIVSDAAHQTIASAGHRTAGDDGSARLLKVIDGDTLRVQLADGTSTRVRLLMADAPERSATRASTGHHIDCGGIAALNHMASLVSVGDRLRLTADPTQDSTDQYGRRLAYVSHDGQDLGRAMIRDGWAKVYIYDHPGLRVVSYQAAARSARTHSRGAYQACGGDFHRAAQ